MAEAEKDPSTSNYREEILRRIDEQNQKLRPLERIFSSYTHLAENLKKAKSAASRNRTFSVDSTAASASSEEIQRLQEKLSDLYRQKSENDQAYIDATRKLTECEQKLAKVVEERDKLQQISDKMCKKIAELEHSNKKAIDDIALVRDEYLASLAIVKSQKDQIEVLEKEQMQLINKVRELNEQKASLMNEELAQQTLRQQRKIQEDIARAIADTSRDQRANSMLSQSDGPTGTAMLGDAVPSRVQFKFEANESEIMDVLWINSDQFATAGTDRKVRLWRIEANGRQTKVSSLTGCNQAITRIDHDPETKTILGSSNDHAVRLWNMDSQRLLSSMCGHSDKVTVAKFGQSMQAVSGSSDRSIKVWDLRSQRCIKTFFPGSTIHDLIGRVPLGGAAFISGHYDKKIRVWDGRTNDAVQVVEMNGKISSLDMSTDGNYLLCSTRDDTLSLLDTRNFRTLHIYSAEQYRTSWDFSRCVLSPGMEYCAAGSSDGHVFVWNVNNTKIEKILGKGGHEHAVYTVRWNPSGRGLLSGDKQKTVIFWS